MSNAVLGWVTALLALIGILSPAAAAEPAGIIRVQSFPLPFSNYLSGEAKRILADQIAHPAPDFGSDIAAARAYFQKYNDERLAEMRGIFRTHEEHASLGGVPVEVVTPAGEYTLGNRARVLINVHGGGFMWGGGSGALVEAIPIAATGRIKVVTVEYRLAPEHHYPAASQDVAKVYATLLKRYRPENIGIYGCSAGGIITAQAVAWFQTHRLPTPGAIGTFCGTGAPYGGDSVFLSGPTTGAKPMVPGTTLPDTIPTSYLSSVAASDTEAYPVQSDRVLARFPPTLLLAGSRDFAASVMAMTHRRMARLGVPSELYIFDGLPHAFFVWPNMPESREAYRLIARFFDEHLGHQRK